jgi:hypothetical protein
MGEKEIRFEENREATAIAMKELTERINSEAYPTLFQETEEDNRQITKQIRQEARVSNKTLQTPFDI